MHRRLAPDKYHDSILVIMTIKSPGIGLLNIAAGI